MPSDQRPSVQIPRPSITEYQEYMIVPVFPPSDPRARLATPEGNAGVYDVSAVLGVPGVSSVIRDLNMDKLRAAGESLLRPPADATALRFEIEGGHTVTFEANADGRLNSAKVALNASSFADARKQAHDLLMPALSRMSFDHDVAIEIVAL